MIQINQFIKKQKLFIASLRNRESSAGRRTAPHRTCLLHEEMTQKRISTVWDKWPPKKKKKFSNNVSSGKVGAKKSATNQKLLTTNYRIKNIYEDKDSRQVEVWKGSGKKFQLSVKKPEKTAKTADISRRHHWFPCEMTSEKRVQKFHTDEATDYPDLGSVSDWLKICFKNFGPRFSDVIWRGNQGWCREMSAVFQDYESKVQSVQADDNIVEPTLTATSLQRPPYFVSADSPCIDSYLNLSTTATATKARP